LFCGGKIKIIAGAMINDKKGYAPLSIQNFLPVREVW
jgi:hypothetical protein